MGIADILGAITGEAPVPPSNSSPRPASLPPKRKADDDLRSAAPKAPRTDSGVDRVSRPNGNSPRPSPRPTDKPSASSNGRLAPSSSRPPMKPSTLSASKPSTSTSASFSKTNTISNGSKPLPSRPATNSTPSAPPKRSSFAEIMARAKANSDIRESLGKINHKPLERNLTMKERKELKGEDAKKAKGVARNGPPSRSSSASAPSRVPGKNGAERSRVSPTASSANVKAKAKAQAAEEEKKKVKKAALATTGYTGTARPRPGASSTSKAGSSTRGDDRDRSYGRSRYGGPLSAPRSRRRDEEDSELDDFIVDDEDEDDYGRPEPEYYSDDESDMEAGIDDIDAEETAAERRARLEDQQEQLLEIRLKREKEERKRRALEALKRRP